MEAIDTVKQKITLLETHDQRLGMSNVLYLSVGDSLFLHAFMKQADLADGESQLSRVNNG